MRPHLSKKLTMLPLVLVLLMLAPTLSPFAQSMDELSTASHENVDPDLDGTLEQQLQGIPPVDVLELHDYPQSSESDRDSFTPIWGEPNVRSLASSTTRGEIYIGTNTGLIIYHPSTSQVEHLTVADGLPGPLVQEIEVDEANGRLFIGSTTHNNGRIGPGGGISIYDLDTRTFTNRNSIWGISNNNVRAIEYDQSKQRLYLATGSGLSIYDITDERFVNKYRNSGLPSNDLRDVEFDASSKKLYIATFDYSSSGQRKGGGLSVFDTDSWSFTNYNMSDGLLSRNLNTLLLSGGTLYIGCDRYSQGGSDIGGGLNIVDLQSMTFSGYSYTNGLRSDEVISLALDPGDQKLYIATNRYGSPARGGSLNILDLTTGHFDNRTTSNGLLTTYVQRLLYHPSLGIICGCDRGYCTYSPSSDSFSTTTLGDGLPGLEIRSVLEYGERHTLFIGTRFGLFIQDTRTGDIIKRDTTNGLPNDDARAMALDKSTDKLYVATWGGGIGIYDIPGDTFDVLSTSDGLRTNNILCLTFNDRKLYIGEWERGLCIYDTVQDTMTQIGLNDGMPSHRIRNIEVEPDGSKVYIATTRYWNGSEWTGGGLCIYDAVFYGCTVIDQDAGLMSNEVFGLALDPTNDLLYIGTSRYWDGHSTWYGGLTFLSTTTHAFNSPDPAPFSDINIQSIEVVMDGELVLLGCNRALGIFKDGKVFYRDLQDGLSYSNIYDIDVNETTGVLHMASYASYCRWDFDLPATMVSQIPEMTMSEDDLESGNDLVDLSQYFKDPKGETLIFTVIEMGPHVKALLDENNVTLDLVPGPDYSGLSTFKVQVRDAGLDRTFGTWDDLVINSNEFTVNVLPTNDPPQFTVLDGASPTSWNKSIQLVEGARKEIFFCVEDRDGDLLSIEWSILATPHRGGPILREGSFSQLSTLDDAPFQAQTSLVSFKPGDYLCNFSLLADGDFHHFNITLEASDPSQGTTKLSLDINIIQTNDAPTIISIGDVPVDDDLVPITFSVLEGNTLSLEVEAYDPDMDEVGDTLWFGSNLSQERYPGFIDRSTGEISFAATSEHVGTFFAQVFVGDGEDQVSDHFVNISITVEPLIELPTIAAVLFHDVLYPATSVPPLHFQEDRAENFEVIINDPNALYGNATPLELEVNHSSAVITGNGDPGFSIDLTPDQDDVGTLWLSVVIYDKENSWEYHGLNISFDVENTNDPPEYITIISPLDNYQINSNQTLNLTGTASDQDLPFGDRLIYRWFSNISGLLGKGPMVPGILLPPGAHELTLEVFDLEGETGQTRINVTVQEPMEDEEDDLVDGEGNEGKHASKGSNTYWYVGAILLALGLLNLLILLLNSIRKNRPGEEMGVTRSDQQIGPTEPIVLTPTPLPASESDQDRLPTTTTLQARLDPTAPTLLLPQGSRVEDGDRPSSYQEQQPVGTVEAQNEATQKEEVATEPTQDLPQPHVSFATPAPTPTSVAPQLPPRPIDESIDVEP